MSLVNFLKFGTLKRQRQVSELSQPFEKKEKRSDQSEELRLLFVIACFRDIACSHFKVIALVCSIFYCTCPVVYVVSN
jgi:hypothetical protein